MSEGIRTFDDLLRGWRQMAVACQDAVEAEDKIAVVTFKATDAIRLVDRYFDAKRLADQVDSMLGNKEDFDSLWELLARWRKI